MHDGGHPRPRLAPVQIWGVPPDARRPDCQRAMAGMVKRKQGEAHVRLYRHELQSAAYRSLSCDARALLTEFRALYTGKENRVYMSVREAMNRTGLSQRPAQRAIADLLDRGFIRLLEKGSFHCKAGPASLYQLTSEPPNNRDGSVPSKDFMRWQPKKHGNRSDYRGTRQHPRKCAQR